MKFNCNKEIILKELKIANDIISQKNSLSILSNIFLKAENNQLIIKATDENIFYNSIIPINCEVEGSVNIYCDIFLNILQRLPDEDIEFERKESEFIIKYLEEESDQKSYFSLKLLIEEDFKYQIEDENNQYFSINQKDFNEMINQSIFSVSQNKQIPFLTGILVEKEENKLVMVATDTSRMSIIKKDINDLPEFKSQIVPTKILKIIKKYTEIEENIEIAINDKKIFFKFNNKNICSNLIEGNFPNYKRVIPENLEKQVIIKKEDLNIAINRVSILVPSDKKMMIFDLKENLLKVITEKSELGKGQAVKKCIYNGPEEKIAVNYQHIFDPLKFIEENDIMLKFSDVNKAFILTSVPEKDYKHIIMPMNIN